MRNAGLIAFWVTTCVLVPAAIHRLSAGKEQIAKLSAPSEDSFELRGAKVQASLDRYMLDPGESLTVRIAATEATGKTLEVGVLVLGSNGSEGDRVPTPPNGVAFRILKLPVKDGVATGDMTVVLEGSGSRRWNPFGHYEVLVGAPNAIEKLESLRRRSGLINEDDSEIPSLNRAGSTFMGLYRGWGIPDEDQESPYIDGKLARLEAHTRPKSGAIALTVPDTASVDKTFVVSVTVTNPSKHAMKNLEVNLAEQSTFSSEYVDPVPTRIEFVPDKRAIDLAAHETRTVQFEVTPSEAGVIGIYANANCLIDYESENANENKKACRDVQALQLGAFDATEVRMLDEKAPAVVAR